MNGSPPLISKGVKRRKSLIGKPDLQQRNGRKKREESLKRWKEHSPSPQEIFGMCVKTRGTGQVSRSLPGNTDVGTVWPTVRNWKLRKPNS